MEKVAILVTSPRSFTMAGGQKRGMPAPVKAVLSKFGGGREEDKLVGYLSFLKIGPKLLRFLPGKKVRDLRNWLTIYGYWNQVGGPGMGDFEGAKQAPDHCRLMAIGFRRW